MLLHFDPTNYQRIEQPNAIETSAGGASFATSTGDLLEVTSFGPGIFRLRLGPHARPDYGIVVGKSKPCTVAVPQAGLTTFTSGEATLEIGGGPLRFRLLWRGQSILGSITDQHFRGFSRLPTFGRIKQGGEWTAAFALASGEPVYGLGEKFGPLDKRGQLIHSQVEDALGVNTGLSYKNTPFAWSPGTGRGAWGVFVHTPGRVAHGVGYPDWSHRSYALVVDDEALDLFLFAADDPAGVLDLYTQVTGRAPEVPALEPGPVGVARLLQDPGGGDRGRAQAARAAHPVRRDHARRTRGVEGEDAVQLPVGPRALRRSARVPRRPQGARLPRVRLGVPVRLDPRPAVPAALRPGLPAAQRVRRSLRLQLGHDARHLAVRQRADAAPRERHRRLHPSRRVCLVARCAQGAVRRRRGRDQERLRRAGARGRRRAQRRSRPAAAQRLPAALQPLRVRGDAQVRPAGQRRRRWCGAGPHGPGSSATRWAGAATRRATGKGSPRRSAAGCRGA